MDTLGSLVDKLITVDMKMWYAQENLYHIREMSLDKFSDEYFNEEGMEILWKALQKSIDLNLQRNNLIDEIDIKIASMVETGEGDVQLKHKTHERRV